MSTTVFASETPTLQGKTQFLPQVTCVKGSPEVRVPNFIPISVKPAYNKLVVHVGNLGVDPLDSVTVKGSVTDYGTLSPITHSVPPVLGKDFTWSIPQTKCHMEYDVTIRIVDGSGTDNKTGHAELDYTNSKLEKIGWGQGTFSSRTASLDYHFSKHHREVGVSNLYDYLIAADNCRQDALSHSSSYTVTQSGTNAHKYKNKNDRRFVIISDSNNDILSFGK